MSIRKRNNLLQDPSRKAKPIMTKNTDAITFENFAAELYELVGKYAALPVTDEPTVKTTKKKAVSKPEPVEPEVDEDDDEEGEEEGGRLAELESMTVAALRKEAIKAGYSKDDVKEADKETLVNTLIEDEDEEEEDLEDESDEDEDEVDESDEDDDEEEDEDDEDEDDEEEDYDEDELQGMTLPNLKKILKERDGETTQSLKGLDKDSVISMILGEEGDEEEDEEDEDEDDEWYSEEELNDMSLAELKEIARDNDIKIKAGMKKADYIKALLA